MEGFHALPVEVAAETLGVEDGALRVDGDRTPVALDRDAQLEPGEPRHLELAAQPVRDLWFLV